MTTQLPTEPSLLFTAQDVVSYTNAKYRNIDHWVREGVIRPVMPARGSGSVRVYDFPALVAVRVLLDLREFGVETRVIGEIIEWIRQCPQVQSIKAARDAMKAGEFPSGLSWDGRVVVDYRLVTNQGHKPAGPYVLLIAFDVVVSNLVQEISEETKKAAGTKGS